MNNEPFDDDDHDVTYRGNNKLINKIIFGISVVVFGGMMYAISQHGVSSSDMAEKYNLTPRNSVEYGTFIGSLDSENQRRQRIDNQFADTFSKDVKAAGAELYEVYWGVDKQGDRSLVLAYSPNLDNSGTLYKFSGKAVPQLDDIKQLIAYNRSSGEHRKAIIEKVFFNNHANATEVFKTSDLIGYREADKMNYEVFGSSGSSKSAKLYRYDELGNVVSYGGVSDGTDGLSSEIGLAGAAVAGGLLVDHLSKDGDKNKGSALESRSDKKSNGLFKKSKKKKRFGSKR